MHDTDIPTPNILSRLSYLDNELLKSQAQDEQELISKRRREERQEHKRQDEQSSPADQTSAANVGWGLGGSGENKTQPGSEDHLPEGAASDSGTTGADVGESFGGSGADTGYNGDLGGGGFIGDLGGCFRGDGGG